MPVRAVLTHMLQSSLGGACHSYFTRSSHAYVVFVSRRISAIIRVRAVLTQMMLSSLDGVRDRDRTSSSHTYSVVVSG